MVYFDLGPYKRTISTGSQDAQLWFNRGLIWTYSYNHELAIDCFKTALEHDAECAMAHWGIAYASGPNYNFEWWMMDPTTKESALGAAYDHTMAALELSSKTSAAERMLIEALASRYPQKDPIDDQAPWNDSFAVAMRKVHAAFHDDLDIGAIYAEAILNQTPWRMWDIHKGEIASGANTLEAQTVLETFLKTPEGRAHPGILHLYVHLMEMSPTPEKALVAGDHLRELVPDAGHLVHMPTHIDIQCGAYHDVVHWNLKGIEADLKVAEEQGRMNFYTGYRIHNYRFVVYGAMFLGQYQTALTAAEDIVKEIPEDLLQQKNPPMADFLESEISTKIHVQIRFGRWDDIIKEPLPTDQDLYCFTTAIQHYAKTVAYAALGDVENAKTARDCFFHARKQVPKSRYQHNVRCTDLLDIAEQMLLGELEYRLGNFDVAFDHLKSAIKLEDALPYDEPWGWMQPIRHALGGLALEQGRIDEAENAYREDLGLAGNLPRACIHPDNVWSLKGLYECLKRRGLAETTEAKLIQQRLAFAVSRADLPIDVSCFCAQPERSS